MNKQTWNEIATTPFGEHPSDKFINATAIYHDSLENTGSFFIGHVRSRRHEVPHFEW